MYSALAERSAVFPPPSGPFEAAVCPLCEKSLTGDQGIVGGHELPNVRACSWDCYGDICAISVGFGASIGRFVIDQHEHMAASIARLKAQLDQFRTAPTEPAPSLGKELR